jgi:transcription elongation factor Elf1
MSARAHGVRSFTVSPLEAVCVGCGCSDLRACAGGCSWLAVNRDDGTGVCSNCGKRLTAWRHQQAQDAADAFSPDVQKAMEVADMFEATGQVVSK